MITILVALTIWSTPSFAADSCSTIDLSNSAGGSYDQIDTSWCHIFTTTDAFSQHLRNKKVLKAGERVHPLQMAAAVPAATGRSVVNSTDNLGNPLEDMIALSKASVSEKDSRDGSRLADGLCRESDLGTDKQRALALFNGDWRKAKRMFDATDCFVKQGCSRAVPASAPVRQLCDKISKNERKYWYDLFRKKCRLAWPDWHMRYNFRKTRFAKIQEGKQLRPAGDGYDQMLKEDIDKALQSNEFAAIGYDASFMRSGNPKTPESHWSSIVGRRRGPDGKCYYGLRNSWGNDCGQYNASVQCKKNGYLLVSEEELISRIHTVHYFDEPGKEVPPKPVWTGPGNPPPTNASLKGP